MRGSSGPGRDWKSTQIEGSNWLVSTKRCRPEARGRGMRSVFGLGASRELKGETNHPFRLCPYGVLGAADHGGICAAWGPAAGDPVLDGGGGGDRHLEGGHMTDNQANLVFWLVLGVVCLCYPPVLGFLFGVAVVFGMYAVIRWLLQAF